MSAYYHFCLSSVVYNEPALGLGELAYRRDVLLPNRNGKYSAVHPDNCAAKLCCSFFLYFLSESMKMSKFQILHGDDIGTKTL